MISGEVSLHSFNLNSFLDAVNVASRMESTGLPGHVQVSASTYELVKDFFLFENRGKVSVKGKGEMETYIYKGTIPGKEPFLS